MAWTKTVICVPTSFSQVGKPVRSLRHARVEKANEQSMTAFVSTIPRES